MNQFKSLRQRAVNLLQDKLVNEQPTSIDYQIDDYLRKALALPDRPAGDEPYVGWIVGKKPPDTSKRKTSEQGVSLIKRHEGLRTSAYICPGGVLTIGYGHTKTVYPQMSITPQQAEELLTQDLQRFENSVSELVKVPLSQGQFDALVSFSFNVGANALRNSTLLRLLNQGKYREAAAQFGRWSMANGSRLPGLIRRRAEEQHLFNES